LTKRLDNCKENGTDSSLGMSQNRNPRQQLTFHENWEGAMVKGNPEHPTVPGQSYNLLAGVQFIALQWALTLMAQHPESREITTGSGLFSGIL
jgi:hypothetical protein